MLLVKLPETVRLAVLEHFSPNVKKRSKAALVILKHVDEEFRKYSGKGTPNSVEDILKALVTRLTKNNKEGIYTTLQTLLNLHGTAIEVTYKLLQEQFSDEKMKNLDDDDDEPGTLSDKMVSEILGYSALIRSAQLAQHPQIFEATVSRLLSIMENEGVDVMATVSLNDLLERYPDAIRKGKVWKHLEKLVKVPYKEMSPCALWVRLVLMRKCADSPTWLSSTLDEDNYKDISQVLMKCTTGLPKIHPVFEEIIGALSKLTTDEDFPLGSFWKTLCFSNLHSNNKKALELVMSFLQMILPKLTRKSEVESVLTRQLIAYFMRTLRTEKVLRAAVPSLTAGLEKLVQTDTEKVDELRLAVVEALILHPGNIRFDAITKTSILATVFKHLSVDNIKTLAANLAKMLKEKDTLLAEQTTAAEALSNLLSHPRLVEEASWKQQQLQILLIAALMPRKTGAFKNAFLKSLYQEAQKAENILEFLKSIIDFANSKVQSSGSKNQAMRPEVKEEWDKVFKSLTSLEKEKKAWPDKCHQILQMLYYAMIIFILQDLDDAIDLMPKVDEFCKVTRKQNLSSVLIDSSFWITKTVRMLVSFRPEDNTVMRTVIREAFRLIAEDQIPETICELIDIIEPAAEEEGDENVEDEDDEGDTFHEGLKEEDEEDEDEEDEDEDEEEGEDEDEDDDEEGDGEEAEDMDDDDDEEEEDDMDLDDHQEPTNSTEEMKEKLRKDLMALQEGEEDIDLDEVPAEELEDLDKKLGDIFAEYKAKEKTSDQKLPKKERVNKKYLLFRAYDFLEIYIGEGISMGLTLGVIKPIMDSLAALETEETVGITENEAKKMRLRKLLEQIGNVKTFKNVDMSPEEIAEEFESFNSYSVDYPPGLNPYVTACQKLILNCSIKVLGKRAHTNDNPIVKLYSEFLVFLLDRKEATRKIQVYSGACSLDWGSLRILANDMTAYAFEKAASFYSKANALTVLCELFKNKGLFKRLQEKQVKDLGVKVSRGILRILHMFNNQLQSRFLSNLGDLLAILKQNHSEPETSGIDWEEIKAVVIKHDTKLDPDETVLRGAIQQYLAVLRKEKKMGQKPMGKLNNKKKIKRELDDDEERPKKKQKKNVKTAEKKKQVTFAEDDDFAPGMEDGEQRKRKKKLGKKRASEPIQKKGKVKSKRKKASKRTKKDDS